MIAAEAPRTGQGSACKKQRRREVVSEETRLDCISVIPELLQLVGESYLQHSCSNEWPISGCISMRHGKRLRGF